MPNNKTMKKAFIIFMCITGTALLLSCGGNKEKVKQEGSDSTAVTSGEANLPSYARFGLKSAIIGMKSVTMGLEQQVSMYIDDYGRKHATEFVTEIMGIKSQQLQITDSLYVYNLDMQKKQGTKVKIDKSSAENINFTKLDEKTIAQFNIKKEGSEEVIGLKCDIYSLDFGNGKLKGKYYVWKGIPLKTEASVGGIKVKMEATHIEQNAEIPPSRFQIPEGFTIREISAEQAMP
jgi:hypothetical protein